MGYIKSFILIWLFAMLPMAVSAQAITSIHGTVTDDYGAVIGATVCEIDAVGRIIESAVTDLNGNFSMKVRNPKDKVRFSYIGLKSQTLPINKTTFNVRMKSDTQQLKEVTVKSKKRLKGNSLPIPEREISFATQSLDTKEFEGLGITTIDEALQGRIAGLDIIGNSGNLGSGSTIRLRGSSSLSSLTNANPLIVVDGNIQENVDMSTFDLSGSSDEQFAELLKINPNDIASINVLKDGAALSQYGTQGGNGVIEIFTKRGVKGKPRLSYALTLSGTYQPKGINLLSGDDYTMMLKESYFNPQQSDAASDINEINYDPNFSEYEQYNNNTDWRKAVTQWGLRQNHYVTISGGGDKAQFRISGGFDRETGSVIKQLLNRFSTRVNLDYSISQRIRVSTNFAMTYTKNNQNYDNLLSIAQKKMPNMSIYEQDPLTGEDTNRYYTMLQTGSDVFKDDQKKYVNPVASANLATNVSRAYDIVPELVINYDLLGLDDEHTRLTWRGQVYMNVSNNYIDKFYPQELLTIPVSDGVNTAYSGSSKRVSFTTKHTLTFMPAFKNTDHSLISSARFELTTGNNTGQSTGVNGLPSGISSPYAGGQIYANGLSSNFSEWRSMSYTLNANYSYKEKYIIYAALRADGTTKFGPGRRWGYFPSVSLRWNIIDEKFMDKFRSWLKMLSIRPGWGRVGHAPTADYLYTSKYVSANKYLDMSAIRLDNLKLSNLKWETVNSFNLGFDLKFFEGERLGITFEVYNSTRSDMLMDNFRISSNSGFPTLAYYNTGKLRNTGWEFHVNTNRLIKSGKFTLDLNANFGNNRNEILEMDETVLKNKNSTFTNDNRQVLTRVQLHNPFGAIYGFRSLGVYQYEYDYLRTAYTNTLPEGEKFNIPGFKNWINNEFLASGKTAPIATNPDGTAIFDDQGMPIQMMFAYSNDNSGRNYVFKGGDAMYEDINHDGQINALDIVYLGSSLPKLTGGFGFSFTYGNWRLNTQFTYRVGNKILNMARLDSEAMINNDNQSQAVNYRWRKNGDVTTIPRAMYGATSNYNTLISDRFVEDGSYLRMGYAQLSYSLNKKWLKAIGFQGIRLYVSANNPFIITKYTGVDPDVSYGGYGAATDWGQTPRARSYTFGMTVDF